MPKPASLADLVAVIRSSRLVAEDGLAAAVDGVSPAGDMRTLLGQLIEAGHLTAFQADQIGRGRWRGFMVGPYRLLDLLGRGGSGHVYLGRHDGTGHEVAIKLLDASLVGDPVARTRFLREVQAAAGLAHPNFAQLVDADLSARPPYLVMEYIDGVSLQAAVARQGTFAGPAAAAAAHQIAVGLQHVHEQGLVHRDIKPANVLIDRAGRVKILDLGIVKRGAEKAGLTMTASRRMILGTADYLAPEQAVDSSAVDTRADLYALGGTLYFLLAGHSPFPAGKTIDKLVAKQTTDPAPLGRLRPDLPARLCAVVHALLARNPADRPPTPAAAAGRLARFAAADPGHLAKLFVAPVPPGRPGQSAALAAPEPTRVMAAGPGVVGAAPVRNRPSAE